MPSLNVSYASTGEAAKILGMHPLAVQKLIYRGTLPAEKIANRWLILKDALSKFAITYNVSRGCPRVKRKYTKRSPRWQAS